ncbi:MAG: response regulator transcription factor [Alphaproteobacteria bacterium]|nr:response regulator transcription factor [Alphaproteobacteria bacterium]
MRILLIEDEEKLAKTLADSLKAEGFSVDMALDGAHGARLAETCAYDLIVIDIMLPGLDGTEVLRGIRARMNDVPVLMLTARDSVQDKVTHFEAGADDYLTKPFSFAEFLVRVRALMRRRPAQQTDVIRIGDFELDRLTHKIRRGGDRIELSAKEYALLEYLAMNAGRILSRTMIIEHVWDQSFESLTNIVEVYIRQLRNKIDDGREPKLIRTVRGAGYVFGDEDAP